MIKALLVEKSWRSRRFLEEFASKALSKTRLDRLVKEIDAESQFENVEQLKQAIVEWCALSRRFTDDSIDQRGAGCSVSYKRMVDVLNTNSSSLDVFTVALLFSYRR